MIADGIGALAGAVIYSAVFVLAAVLTTRAIAYGLLYVLISEGLLSNLVGGARILSIAHYCLGIANAIHPDQNLEAGLTQQAAQFAPHPLLLSQQ